MADELEPSAFLQISGPETVAGLPLTLKVS
jgi:hypothetical protein